MNNQERTAALLALYKQRGGENVSIAELHKQVRKDRAAKRVRLRGQHADLVDQITEDVVYFVAIADLIKIGHTRRLRARLTNLNVTSDALLAIELGGVERERELHKQFASARIRNELFERSPDLLAYIASLRPINSHGASR